MTIKMLLQIPTYKIYILYTNLYQSTDKWKIIKNLIMYYVFFFRYQMKEKSVLSTEKNIN